MAMISASMVKELREKTGAGMMDCKAALNETKGAIEPAIDWLRKKGLAKAAKKSGRVAAEGLVALAHRGDHGVVVEVNSETDFVARNEGFQKLVRDIAHIALEKGDNIEALKAADYPGGGTVADALSQAIATIGENMTLRRAKRLAVSNGIIGTYIHNLVAEGVGKIAVLVALESPGKHADLATFGREIAMHVAAANPLALDSTSLDKDTVARERAILAEKHQGKPAHVIEKIVDSGLKTFYKEVCLIDQAYVRDPSKTVGQAVQEFGNQIKQPLRIAGFVRYALGEGIEKSESDFAAEVAAAVKG
ncbi:MAG: elongation factor Ts [Hyphomicrobiales bacterium]|nr:elongation factor Ts [Hyphomicrobiales bacterium]MBV9433362.1 elongation factor Ts [Hyphomicrobiales bacterium]MBV9741255.1 elongation factor Ts [Hyphomicrobiales bacterium]